VTDLLRMGTRVRIRIKFNVQILNLVTLTVDNICGDCFFDGTLSTS
jgi:hypothetical protein